MATPKNCRTCRHAIKLNNSNVDYNCSVSGEGKDVNDWRRRNFPVMVERTFPTLHFKVERYLLLDDAKACPAWKRAVEESEGNPPTSPG